MNKHKSNIKHILASACLIGAAAGAFAVPAYRGTFTVTQPDGTELEVMLRGDERAHWLMTVDGCLLTETAGGRYEYASVAADGTMAATGILARDRSRRTEAEQARTTMFSTEFAEKSLAARNRMRKAAQSKGPGLYEGVTFPTRGEQRALVILVEFQDIAFGSKNGSAYSGVDAHEYFNDMLNKEGFDTFGGTGSVRDWFVGNSDGQFLPTFDLVGPVKLSQDESYYGRNTPYGDDQRPAHMILEACKLVDDEVDFSRYDCDGNGIVDNVYVFYAGFGEADGGPAYTIWPHSWELTSGGFTRSERTFDGVLVNRYACSNETDYTKKRPDGIGTFVHEFSHVMGLPDLYHTANGSAFTPGSFSVMDYGPYNNNGCTPPNYSAYERYALGWINPETFSETSSYTLENLADSNKAYIVNTADTNEFYLIENRQNTGWDAYLPGHGMLVWHVDYVPEIFTSNTVNNTDRHQYVDLVEADGRKTNSTRGGDTFPGTSKITEFGPDTTPALRSWKDADLGITISEITEEEQEESDAAALIKMHVEVDSGKVVAGADAPVYDPADATVEYYNLQGIRVAEPVPGRLMIVRRGGVSSKVMF